MIHKAIIWFGELMVLACDAKCEKAWGVNGRPHIQLSDDEDDVVFMADDELGTAPEDPGTYEGGDAKPTWPGERLNKWCARECERHSIEKHLDDVTLPDFSRRLYNIAPHYRPHP